MDDQHYALRLPSVDRVIHAVEINALPHAPEIVLGIVNVRGQVIPVINLRRRFRLPEREIALSDRIIIAHTARRTVGLVVDAMADVMDYPEQSIAGAESILPGLEYVEGVMKLPDGLVYIHDLDRFLFMEEETSLDEALETA
jgi:purine-binding chemotaxis protein CheW